MPEAKACTKIVKNSSMRKAYVKQERTDLKVQKQMYKACCFCLRFK